MLPRSSTNHQTERAGIIAVAAAINALGLIWRETPTSDVGIDGQVEHVNEQGQATGRLLSVQVKSGPSYLKHEDEHAFCFYPAEKHRNYWEQHPLPVILVLHDPTNHVSFWSEVRQQLRGEKLRTSLIVPKRQKLQETSSDELFATTGVTGGGFIGSSSELVAHMVRSQSGNACFPVSYFEMFCHGLTNISRSIYYGVDVPMMIAEANLASVDSESGLGIGPSEQEFMFNFVRFLITQNLARVEFADCLVNWIDREMQPQFVAPLTSRGRALTSYLHDVEADMVRSALLPEAGCLRVAQEAFFSMVPESFSGRPERTRMFQNVWRHHVANRPNGLGA